MKKTIIFILKLLVLFSLGLNLNLATAKRIKRAQESYSFSEELDPSLYLINVTGAYNQGITGKGVNVKLFTSSLDANHPQLAGKVKFRFGDSSGENYLKSHSYAYGYSQATGYAGAIAAGRAKDSMHGVAFDSTLDVIRTDFHVDLEELLELFTQTSEIIFFDAVEQHDTVKDTAAMIYSMARSDKLIDEMVLAHICHSLFNQLVFVANVGEEGHFYPFAPYFDRDGSLSNYLLVGSINAESLIYNMAGKLLKVPPSGILSISSLPGISGGPLQRSSARC